MTPNSWKRRRHCHIGSSLSTTIPPWKTDYLDMELSGFDIAQKASYNAFNLGDL
jgi:hypothetical protein